MALLLENATNTTFEQSSTENASQCENVSDVATQRVHVDTCDTKVHSWTPPTDISLLDGWRVVNTISRDGDHVALALTRLDDEQLLCGDRARKHDVLVVQNHVVKLHERHIGQVCTMHHDRWRISTQRHIGYRLQLPTPSLNALVLQQILQAYRQHQKYAEKQLNTNIISLQSYLLLLVFHHPLTLSL